MSTKRVLSILGYLFSIAGAILILLPAKALTGFAILENISSSIKPIGILSFIIGLALILVARGWDSYKVRLVVEEYESGTLNPVQAAIKINDRLFPEGVKITGVDYRGDTKETIKTTNKFIPVRLNSPDKARDLALALYEIALINDRNNARNCELHLGKNASSKHHKQGLKSVIEDFESEYHSYLELAKSH